MHKNNVTAIIKDWQLPVAFYNQKSQVNSQVQLLESDRGQKAEGETGRRGIAGEQNGGGRREERALSSPSWGAALQAPRQHLQRALGALSPAGGGPGIGMVVPSPATGAQALLWKFVGTTMGTSGRCTSLLVHTLYFVPLGCFCPQTLIIMRADTVAVCSPLFPVYSQYSQTLSRCLIKTVFVE